MKIFIGKNNACGLNYEHNYIYGQLVQKYEITDTVWEADAIIFAGTCSGTEFSILVNIQYMEEVLKNKKEGSKVYLTGCMSREFKDIYPLTEYQKWLNKNIDFIIPQNQLDLLFESILDEPFMNENVYESSLFDIKDDYANLYISGGCLNNCSFCKVTFQKFPLKSVALSEVKSALDLLDERGIETIYIKGTNVCQYGLDAENTFLLPTVIEYIESKRNIQNVELIGFSFKDAIKNDFNEVLKESTKVKCLSGSLESGSDRLLELIRKGFTSNEIIDFIRSIRQKRDIELYLNIIAGFPTETMQDVRKTLDVLKELDPYSVDVCRYINSSFIDSNKYEQLSSEKIQEHTRVYSKVLTRRGVNVDIVGQGYKYNNINI